MNKDQSSGHIDQAKGKIKEIAGDVTGNKTLKLKGTTQNAAGKMQAAFGDIRADIKKAAGGK